MTSFEEEVVFQFEENPKNENVTFQDDEELGRTKRFDSGASEEGFQTPTIGSLKTGSSFQMSPGLSNFFGKSPHSSSSVATNAAQPLSRFLLKQKADGSWILDSQFAKHLGKTIEQLTSSLPLNLLSKSQQDLWITALAITYLETKFKEQRHEWESMVFLSKDFLLQRLGDSNQVNQLLLQAQKEQI